MEVGKYIKYLRTQKGISQSELGKVVGVQRAAVQKWESGATQNLKRITMQKLADYFDVKPCGFVSDDLNEPTCDALCEINRQSEKPEPPILTKYNKLNNKGKEKTDSYVDDLLESPKYVANQKYIVYGEEKESYPAVAAPDITPARANPKKKQIKHSN